MRLEGKVVIVTGAANGIGRACVVRHRHHVIEREPAAIGIDGLARDVARILARQEHGDTRPPASEISATALAPFASSTSATTTAAPSTAKRFAQARPIPFAAPVTMTTFPSSLMVPPRRAQV